MREARGHLLTSHVGTLVARREVDPLGSEVGTSDPFPPAAQVQYWDVYGGDLLFLEAGDAFDIRGGCTLDGLPVSCSYVRDRMAAGSVAVEVRGRDGRTRQLSTKGIFGGST